MAHSEKRVALLEAKVTALTMLVETLWAVRLSSFDDPGAAATKMTEAIFKTEEAARKRGGDSETALQISDVLTSLLDRAVLRAVQIKGDRQE